MSRRQKKAWLLSLAVRNSATMLPQTRTGMARSRWGRRATQRPTCPKKKIYMYWEATEEQDPELKATPKELREWQQKDESLERVREMA